MKPAWDAISEEFKVRRSPPPCSAAQPVQLFLSQ